MRLEFIDAVSACTPNGGHCAHTIGALKAGAHVLVENLMVQKMLDGIYESAEKGKEVPIR